MSAMHARNHRPLVAVVLAAGEGTRMRSTRPKPLHFLCGRPMVLHVLDALAELPIERVVVVVGHGREWVSKALREGAPDGLAIEFVEQVDPRGTGEAMAVALTGLPEAPDGSEEADVVVLPGDTPLVRAPTIAALVRHHRSSGAAATVLSAVLDNPTGYSRVLMGKDDRVARLVDDAHLRQEEAGIHEVATSIYCFRRSVVAPALRRLSPANDRGEYFLTDAIEVLYEAGHRVGKLVLDDPMEAAGVNDRAQLALAESELRSRTNERWMRRGVTMIDPEQIYLDALVQLSPDVTLFPGVVMQGRCVIEEGAEIGPDTHLVDVLVGKRARLRQSVATQSEIGDDAQVGPFAVLEPGTTIPGGTVTGPFYLGCPDHAS